MKQFEQKLKLRCLYAIPSFSVRDLNVFTPSDFNFHYAWLSVLGRNYVSFEARACADVHLVLSLIQGKTNKCSLLIGIFLR